MNASAASNLTTPRAVKCVFCGKEEGDMSLIKAFHRVSVRLRQTEPGRHTMLCSDCFSKQKNQRRP